MRRPKHRPANELLFARYRAALAGYAHAPYNYDPALVAHHTQLPGWQYDRSASALPPEPPGPPLPQGSFAAARELMFAYAFPPPDLLVGTYDPALPLDQRIMLLRARFLGFTFRFGVKVVDVVDEVRGEEQVWGYGYRTLQGHFERGQINFSVHKNLRTGAVEFRMASVSQRGCIRNPFYWFGFLLFGRTLQKRFVRQSHARMRALVAEMLAAAQTMPAPVS